MIDCAAVELFGDSAGRCLAGVLVVDAEGEDGVDETGEGEDADQVAHVLSILGGGFSFGEGGLARGDSRVENREWRFADDGGIGTGSWFDG
jgi:hypothetical protein